MCRSLLLSAFLTLTYFSFLIIANGNSTCLEKYSGIYLIQNKDQKTQLTLYSSDGTLVTIDSDQKAGSPTIKGRSDISGQWKCSDSGKPNILTQSLQIVESPRAAAQLVARLYETGTTCSDNQRTNCSDIVQYRELNITISIDPPKQIYTLSPKIHSSEARSLLLHYNSYTNQRRQDLKCLKKKSGLYVIEYEKKSNNGGVKKTYGLFLLKNDGTFSLINSDERENGTHRFGTTIGRWRCAGNRIFATGNYFIYYPRRKLGEVKFSIGHCSSPITHACTGYAKSRRYPLQLHPRRFKNGTAETTEKITMLKYLSPVQTKNKRCYDNYAGTYFSALGGSNDTSGVLLFNGVYRTRQLFRDGRAYTSQTAEILTEQSVGNLIGYWTCNEINSTSTQLHVKRAQFQYDVSEGRNLAAITTEWTCNDTIKTCAGYSVYSEYHYQLPHKGQFRNATVSYVVQPMPTFYAYLPPY